MTDLRGIALDCPRNPPKTPPETAGTLVVCTGQIVLGRTSGTARVRGRADVAQLVEHLHGKQEVPGSNPGVGFAFFACQSLLSVSRATSTWRFSDVVRGRSRAAIAHDASPTLRRAGSGAQPQATDPGAEPAGTR